LLQDVITIVQLATIPNAHFVDAYSALDRYPRRQMLLRDGLHLTLKGQAVVADCLHEVLSNNIADRQAETEPARTMPASIETGQFAMSNLK
jgi:hypothetical protein